MEHTCKIKVVLLLHSIYTSFCDHVRKRTQTMGFLVMYEVSFQKSCKKLQSTF